MNKQYCEEQYLCREQVETIQECVIRVYRVYNSCGCERQGTKLLRHVLSDIFNTDYTVPKVMGKPVTRKS